MAITNYRQWTQDGSPWSPATCIADLARTLRGHGFTVYTIGDVNSHLKADPPEDHCPYSATPWPGAQPYPRVLACDVMPGGSMDWRALGERIVADRAAGKPGTEWIKYINYTDRAGNVWHASWQPGYTRRPSSDTGHIHISARTDHVDTHVSYDPVTGGGTPTPAPVTPAGNVPAYPGYYMTYNPGRFDANVRTWQAQMLRRDWAELGTADGYFGNHTLNVVRQFQANKNLGVDGVIGPKTWNAAWSAPLG